MARRTRKEAAGHRREDEGIQPPYLYPDYVATRLRAPKEPLIILPRALSDITGPAYGRGPRGEIDEDQELRRTLIVREEGDALRFDIHPQGDGKTAFFEL